MKYVTLGKTDLTISEFGFGCIPIIRYAKDDAVRVLRHALDCGITFFDTANAYRDSEEKMGIAFAGKRDKVVLASKTLKRRAEEASGRPSDHGRLSQRTGEEILPALRVLSALSPGGNDNAGHGVPHRCLPDVSIRCGGILQNSHGKRAALHRVWRMHGTLPLRTAG
jgi:hypothetical protein